LHALDAVLGLVWRELAAKLLGKNVKLKRDATDIIKIKSHLAYDTLRRKRTIKVALVR
jgi:hypothetical protein